jgi:HPt (histidine-containing phosphotransfer) domain-containing protein
MDAASQSNARSDAMPLKPPSLPDPIDMTAALERVDGDSELLAEIVELFLQDMETLLADVRSAVQAGDAVRIMRTAHRLKGSVATLAANCAADAALRLEIMGRTGEVAGAPAAFAVLEAELVRLEPALRQIISPAA